MQKISLLAGLAAGLVFAQTQSGPALTVDTNAGRHAISPDIYGINYFWSLTAKNWPEARNARASMMRWGGYLASRYSWKYDVYNTGATLPKPYFEVVPDNNAHPELLPDGSTFNSNVEQARLFGARLMGTIPILGWLPKSRDKVCSFTVARFGAQCSVDSSWKDCGNGLLSGNIGGMPYTCAQNPYPIVISDSDLARTNARNDPQFQTDWIKYLISKYGKASQGGVKVWALDHEPSHWHQVHRDIHPLTQKYDETAQLGIQFATAIKQEDPGARVSGPVAADWASYLFSAKDMVAGQVTAPDYKYWSNPLDRKDHGNTAFVPWYLQQFHQYDQQHGQRLLDYLDLHAGILPSALSDTSVGDATKQALRLKSTRALWDANYVVSNDNIRDEQGKPVAPQLIPRMRQWIEQNYPGTKTAITEYNWGGLTDINGALAQADILGIFGREGLDMAMLNAQPSPNAPVAYAFRMFRNFDGMGGAFGETGVQATTEDPDKLSVFAAVRSDTTLTVVVINKTASDLSSKLDIANFTPASKAQVWRYSAADLTKIVADTDVAVSGNAITATFKANSITMLSVPCAPQVLKVPRPVIKATIGVLNAASNSPMLAPGQMVIISGNNLGPQNLEPYHLDENGLMATSVAGVQVLFDGVPGTIVYAQANQCVAVVPYVATWSALTHVQVEYLGSRSDPFTALMFTAAPGIFTADASGRGQAAMMNDGTYTLNSTRFPAAPGSTVIFWGTGEGITEPLGVDGRFAVDVLPKPVAACKVQIGGKDATVEYCGATPHNVPGMFQVKAKMDPSVAPGDKVPVKVSIGSAVSQDGVTMVVK